MIPGNPQILKSGPSSQDGSQERALESAFLRPSPPPNLRQQPKISTVGKDIHRDCCNGICHKPFYFPLSAAPQSFHLVVIY